jgi:hypothetical protein
MHRHTSIQHRLLKAFMKSILTIIVLFCSLASGSALQGPVFSSWDDLIHISSHIMIVSISNPSYHSDGTALSDAKVISVLKGDGKTNMILHLVTIYYPYDGERLLIFFNGELDRTNAEFIPDGVVPINRLVPLDRLLAGKNLKEQIGILLKGRLKDLNDEMASDNAEKAQLETFFKSRNAATNTISNAPVAVPSPPPTGRRGTF